MLKVTNFYKLYIVTKDKAGEHKSYICPKKYLLDLIYSDITKSFNYSCKGSKYFIIFLNNYNKRLEVEVLEKKSNIYTAYLRYTARNK